MLFIFGLTFFADDLAERKRRDQNEKYTRFWVQTAGFVYTLNDFIRVSTIRGGLVVAEDA